MENDNLPDIGILGAVWAPLKIIDAKGGNVLHMLRSDSPFMKFFPHGIGEIYFSQVETGAIKAWKQHKQQNGLFAVPQGRIKIVLYDTRADSSTLGVLSVLELGLPDDYKLLRIPAGVWYGFTGVSKDTALICNCADVAHDPADILRMPQNDSSIPYQW